MILWSSVTFNVIFLAWFLISLYRIELLKSHRREYLKKIAELEADNTRLALKLAEHTKDL